jgi:hypothetical protein
MRFVDGFVSPQARLTVFRCDLAVCPARMRGFYAPIPTPARLFTDPVRFMRLCEVCPLHRTARFPYCNPHFLYCRTCFPSCNSCLPYCSVCMFSCKACLPSCSACCVPAKCIWPIAARVPLLQGMFPLLQRMLRHNMRCNKASPLCNGATTRHCKPTTPRKSPVAGLNLTFRPTFSTPTLLPTLLPPQPSRYASPRHRASTARAFSANGDSICSKISSAVST